MSNETLGETFSIETPENVAFGYAVAGIGSRFLAALVDSLLILLLQAIVLTTLVVLANTFFGESLDAGADFAWLAAGFFLLAFAFLWGYYIFFEMAWNGQSPGKRWVGLRVIRSDGTPITLTESIIRNLVRLVDFLPGYYGVGVVTMFIDRQSRRLGDLAAGTLVVRDRASVTLESLASQSRPSDAPVSNLAGDASWPIERLSSQDLEMVEEFLRRRLEFPNSAELAARIARRLLSQMGLPADEIQGDRAEQVILQVATAARERPVPRPG